MVRSDLFFDAEQDGNRCMRLRQRVAKKRDSIGEGGSERRKIQREAKGYSKAEWRELDVLGSGDPQ